MRRDPEQVEVHYLRTLAEIDEAHILEVGCGDGRLTWRYASSAQRVTAIDPDPARLTDAVAGRPPEFTNTVTFIRSNSETLPFKAHTFDGAILAWSL